MVTEYLHYIQFIQFISSLSYFESFSQGIFDHSFLLEHPNTFFWKASPCLRDDEYVLFMTLNKILISFLHVSKKRIPRIGLYIFNPIFISLSVWAFL